MRLFTRYAFSSYLLNAGVAPKLPAALNLQLF